MATAKKELSADTQATVLHQDAEHTVYRLDGTDGEVVQTVYPVFPGIEIAYHDVHATACAMQRPRASGCLEIHHCLEGRIAYPYGGACFFLAPGDLAIVQRSAAAAPARFPTGHYHGITVSIDPARAPDCLSCFLEDVEVRPSALIEKFCADAACFVTRSSQGVAHIFSELYSVPEGIRKGYFKVKILELLLFLSAFPMQAAQPQHSYPQSQVQLAEQVVAYLLENTERRLTVAELAQRFGASATLINSSFRGVYGMSPAAFLRAQKMHGTARPASCARPTARCWILPASLGMITAASSPKRSGTSSASRPTPTAAASTATAARRRPRRSDGGRATFSFWSHVPMIWSGCRGYHAVS